MRNIEFEVSDREGVASMGEGVGRSLIHLDVFKFWVSPVVVTCLKSTINILADWI